MTESKSIAPRPRAADTGSSLPFLDKTSPEAMRGLGSAAEAVADATSDLGIPRSVVEVMHLRISQLNGCAYCLHVHHRRAVRAGNSEGKLAQLPAWRDSTAFDAVERAALTIGETITELPDPAVRDRDLLLSRDVLGDDAFAALEWAAILMNAFNRISIVSHHPVPAPS
ncbi:carboxymuconolactone decarboxylase family protein [Brachybacterium sp. FME24]|uniref:carboxymuconolactone decarboxylase family protein n=1 Tax=Brachybacterium sp. FME24 TaxID=2742605 RepID=UPI001D01257A|nr:carboxymuconolactone decarboxylase family protein [Brachybacterium sp. FME24]